MSVINWGTEELANVAVAVLKIDGRNALSPRTVVMALVRYSKANRAAFDARYDRHYPSTACDVSGLCTAMLEILASESVDYAQAASSAYLLSYNLDGHHTPILDTYCETFAHILMPYHPDRAEIARMERESR